MMLGGGMVSVTLDEVLVCPAVLDLIHVEPLYFLLIPPVLPTPLHIQCHPW